jgi:hypothetical protein
LPMMGVEERGGMRCWVPPRKPAGMRTFVDFIYPF